MTAMERISGPLKGYYIAAYTVPADIPAECDLSGSNATDGYSVGINFKVFETGTAGFTGCRSWQEQTDPAIVAATNAAASQCVQGLTPR